MITLYLVNSGLLAKPTLYLSDFFEKNRELYYDSLSNFKFGESYPSGVYILNIRQDGNVSNLKMIKK